MQNDVLVQQCIEKYHRQDLNLNTSHRKLRQKRSELSDRYVGAQKVGG